MIYFDSATQQELVSKLINAKVQADAKVSNAAFFVSANFKKSTTRASDAESIPPNASRCWSIVAKNPPPLDLMGRSSP